MPSTLLWNLHEGSLRALPLTHHGVLHGDVLAPEAACRHLLDVPCLPRVQDSVWTTHYQREQLFVALVLRITTRIWLGWDLLHCSPALSPPPLRHFGGIKEDILRRIMQGFMIPCCRRTRHWTLHRHCQRQYCLIIPSLGHWLLRYSVRFRWTPSTVDVDTNYSALLGIKSPELYDSLCTLNKILRKTWMNGWFKRYFNKSKDKAESNWYFLSHIIFATLRGFIYENSDHIFDSRKSSE